MTTKKVLALFDVDGTLTDPRKVADPATLEHLRRLRERIAIGMVGGSDLSKQLEQLGPDVLSMFDYVFSENGLVAYEEGKLIGEASISGYLGEERLQKLINWILAYLSKIELPVKRGTFVEFRKGMLNVSPIGRSCSQKERDEYEAYDLKHGIRATMVQALKEAFPDYGLTYSIGGQISFDVFPTGWDKTYCLQFVTDKHDEIHFFGDKTFQGGNDYEIYESERTVGHSVTGPHDTIQQTTELFLVD